MNNGHGVVAPSYSTELLIKNKNYDNAVVVWSVLWSILNITINLKILFRLCTFTTWVPGGTFLSYVGTLMSPLPAVTQCTCAHNIFLKFMLTFWIQHFYWPNLSSSFKSVFMHATLLRHEMVLLAQEKTYSSIVWYHHHVCHITLMTQDAYSSLQWLPWLVNMIDSFMILHAFSMILPLWQTHGWHDKQCH